MSTIAEILAAHGPLTGKELSDLSGLDELPLWRLCNATPGIVCRTVGRKYLRLDKSVEGYARISPSIKREFLTYTVVGLEKDAAAIEIRAAALLKQIAGISKDKYSLAFTTIEGLVDSCEQKDMIRDRAAFIIAGDVVYGMSHAEPRPESSTGKMVRGSDLDIIVVTDDLPEAALQYLDKAIYQRKYYLLKNPSYQEEIDYIIKDLSAVSGQIAFRDFPSMVACKILQEGTFLFGSRKIFDTVKDMLREARIDRRLSDMEAQALSDRKNAESILLANASALPDGDCMKLFFTLEESEEIY